MQILKQCRFVDIICLPCKLQEPSLGTQRYRDGCRDRRRYRYRDGCRDRCKYRYRYRYRCRCRCRCRDRYRYRHRYRDRDRDIYRYTYRYRCSGTSSYPNSQSQISHLKSQISIPNPRSQS